MTDSAKEDRLIRILVLGNQCVGKTSIVHQLVYKTFEDRYRPTVETILRKDLRYNERDYPLEVVDTAGLDEYSFMPDDFTGDRYDGYCFVYAINNKESFVNVKALKAKLERKRGLDLVPSQKAVILVGNKTDLEENRQVTLAEGKETAKSWNLPPSSFKEVSAKRIDEIQEVFQTIIMEIEDFKLDKKEKKNCVIQ